MERNDQVRGIQAADPVNQSAVSMGPTPLDSRPPGPGGQAFIHLPIRAAGEGNATGQGSSGGGKAKAEQEEGK